MTRTEERLADALQASAGRVRDDRLRPLPQLGPGLGAEPGTGTGPRRSRPVRAAWRGWLVPLAAAASVAGVIGLALTLTSAPGRLASLPQASRSGPAAGAGGIPRYFVQLAGANSGAQLAGATPVATTVEIRSVSTGAVVASVPTPRLAGWGVLLSAAAAAPDGRTFYVAYNAARSGSLGQIWIYRFSTTSSRLTRIKGGVVPEIPSIDLRSSMAVSPDGTKLALTVATPQHGAGSGPASKDKIVVVDLRTGARSEWAGGLDRRGRALLIPDVSWTPDGRSVVFLALWCNRTIPLELCADASAPAASRAQQVRSVPAASAGGLLTHGSVLLSRWGSRGSAVPVIADVTGGPRPGELTLAVLTTVGNWPVVTVERVAARTGSVLATDYRLVGGSGGSGGNSGGGGSGGGGSGNGQSPRGVDLITDPSGQHLLLTVGVPRGFVTGRISDGTIQLLPLKRQPYSGFPVIAW